MLDLDQRATTNRLLQALGAADFALLQPGFHRLEVGCGFPLAEPGVAIDNVYFPESGTVSVTVDEGRRFEVFSVGREGLVGVPVVLGSGRGPHRATVQMPGSFLQVDAGLFRQVIEGSSHMRATLLLYVQVVLVQATSTATASALFTIEERVARWILMCVDRGGGHEVSMTHEALSLILGVRRPSVTVAVHVLEGERLIRATRGRIAVLDYHGLRARAGGSYGLAEAEHFQLFRDPDALGSHPGEPNG